MLIVTAVGAEKPKVVIPLRRTSKGEWRDALNGTQSGRLGCSDQIEKAYMQLLNREIVGDPDS